MTRWVQLRSPRIRSRFSTDLKPWRTMFSACACPWLAPPTVCRRYFRRRRRTHGRDRKRSCRSSPRRRSLTLATSRSTAAKIDVAEHDHLRVAEDADARDPVVAPRDPVVALPTDAEVAAAVTDVLVEARAGLGSGTAPDLPERAGRPEDDTPDRDCRAASPTLSPSVLTVYQCDDWRAATQAGRSAAGDPVVAFGTQ